MPMSFSVQSSRAHKAALACRISRLRRMVDERRPEVDRIHASQSAGRVNAAACGALFWYCIDLSCELLAGEILAAAYCSLASARGNEGYRCSNLAKHCGA